MEHENSKKSWSQINEKLNELNQQQQRPANEVIIDDVDLRDIFNVKRRTTLNYRKSGKLKYSKINGRNFYFLSDVLEFVKSHQCP